MTFKTEFKNCKQCGNKALLLLENEGLCLPCVQGKPVLPKDKPREFKPNPLTPPNWKCACGMCKQKKDKKTA